ncbi:hypothetical protein I4U23_027142 [Adineta vaga]|nr:hypothetical protein I4U23_027142 [Adineta vaga]
MEQSTIIFIENKHKIHDWLLWSIINIIFGMGFGFLPLIFSLICRKKKHQDDLKQAQIMSKIALILNVLITTIEILFWIIFISYINILIHNESLKSQFIYFFP